MPKRKDFLDITDPELRRRYVEARDVWYSMIGRCERPHLKVYANYGARGIKVCKEWHDKRIFCDWLISHGWEKYGPLSLDRIDNDGDYCPGNCRLATLSEQARNKRSSLKYRDKHPEYNWIMSGKRRTYRKKAEVIKCHEYF